MNDTRVRLNGLRTKLIAHLNIAKSALLPSLGAWRTWASSLHARDGWREVGRAARPVVAFAVGYLAAYIYGNHLPSPAPLWPPDAVLLAALLLTRPRRWWIFLLVTVPIRLLPALAPGVPAWLLPVYLLNDTLEGLLAAGLVCRFAPRPLTFTTLRAMGVYVVCAVLVAPFTAALIGSALIGTAGRVAHGYSYWLEWRTWFLGDALASLIVAPAIVLWITAILARRRPPPPRRTGEALLLCCALLAVVVFIFGGAAPALRLDEPLYYLPMPVLLWAAVRFGPRGIASALSVVTLFAINGVVNATRMLAISFPDQDVLSVQLFLIVIAVPLVLLAAQIQERVHTERALKASEARYRAFFELSAVGASQSDPHEGRVQRVNEAFCRITGYTRQQLIGMRFSSLTHPDDRQADFDRYQRLARGDLQSLSTQKRYVRADGQIVWVQVDVTMLRNDNGEPMHSLAIIQNITERKQMEQALQASEARYRDLVETQSELICRYLPDGTLTFVNDAYCRYFGRARDVLLGTPFPDLLSPAQADRARAGLARLLGQTDVVIDEHEVVRPDGSLGWQRWTDHAIYDAAGNLAEIQAVGRDITERKRAEQEREEARADAERQAEQLDRVFEAMVDGVTVHDAQGRILRENAAQRRLLGMDAAPSGYDQMRLHERMALHAARDEHGHPLAPEEGPLARVLAGEVLHGAETMNIQSRTLDGREVDLNVSAAPLRDREGRLVGAVTIWRDQSDWTRLEREREQARASELALQETNRRMDEFLGIASHELKSPLTALKLALQALTRRLQACSSDAELTGEAQAQLLADAQAYLTRAERAMRRMLRLVGDLLEVTRIRVDALELRPASCDLAAIVREAAQEQQQVYPSHAVHLQLPPSGQPTPLMADADRIGQVITNYLSNALKYSPADRPVLVQLAVAGATATVSVRDQGPGIPANEQARVWELYHRVPAVEVQDGAGVGVGLGLHISRTIVERHGGQVGVVSEVGAGSTFWFSLPLAQAAAADDPAPVSTL